LTWKASGPNGRRAETNYGRVKNPGRFFVVCDAKGFPSARSARKLLSFLADQRGRKLRASIACGFPGLKQKPLSPPRDLLHALVNPCADQTDLVGRERPDVRLVVRRRHPGIMVGGHMRNAFDHQALGAVAGSDDLAVLAALERVFKAVELEPALGLSPLWHLTQDWSKMDLMSVA